MDPKLDERLKAIEDKIQQVEKVVIKIRKVQRTTNTARIMYFMFLILLALGAFYYIQPYIEQITNVYSGVNSEMENFKSFFLQIQGKEDI